MKLNEESQQFRDEERGRLEHTLVSKRKKIIIAKLVRVDLRSRKKNK